MMDLWSSSIYQKELDKVEIPAEILEQLYGKTILVTGGTGMVCSFLIDYVMKKNEVLSEEQKIGLVLLVRNIEVAKVRFTNHMSHKEFHLIACDVTALSDELDDIEFHYVIAGAGNADPKSFSEKPVDTILSNFYGIKNILDIVKKRSCVKVVYISSGEVYGNAGIEVEAFKEEDAYYINSMDVRACYPNGKRIAETLCCSYGKQYGIHFSVARLCYVYGPTIKETDSRAVAQFLRLAAQKKDIVLKSRGEQVRSYCYVADVTGALLYIAVKGQEGVAYNIADNQSNVSISDFAHMVANAANVNCIYEIATEQEKSGYSKVERAVQNPAKLNALGWCAKMEIEEGIQHTIETLCERG